MKETVINILKVNSPCFAGIAVIKLGDLADLISILLGAVSILSTLVMLVGWRSRRRFCDVCPFRRKK